MICLKSDLLPLEDVFLSYLLVDFSKYLAPKPCPPEYTVCNKHYVIKGDNDVC